MTILVAMVCGTCMAAGEDEVRQIELDSRKAMPVGIDYMQPTTLSFPAEVARVIGGDKVVRVGQSMKAGSYEIALEHPAHSNVIVVRGANETAKSNLTVECKGKIYLLQLFTSVHPSYLVEFVAAPPPASRALASATPVAPSSTPKAVASASPVASPSAPQAVATATPVAVSPSPHAAASAVPVAPSSVTPATAIRPSPSLPAFRIPGKASPSPEAVISPVTSGTEGSELILDYTVTDEQKNSAAHK